MITFRGNWYDGATSTKVPAVATLSGADRLLVLRLPDETLLAEATMAGIRISPRLGHTARRLTFEGGALFETEENDAVDRALRKIRGSRGRLAGFVHRLESRLGYVLLAFVVVLTLSAATVRYGVPAAAAWAAFRLPPAACDLAGRHTLKILDRAVLSPSELPEKRQAKILAGFANTLSAHADSPLSIVFRKGGPLGANAFALPSGQIIFTDEMVEASENDLELAAILSHEAAHVVRRHGLRMLIQDSLLAFLVVSITGDAAGTADILMALPMLLAQQSYSREFEKEADRYALKFLEREGIETCHFANLLERIDRRRQEKEVPEAPPQKTGQKFKWTHYLSTHPDTADRLLPFRKGRCSNPVAGPIH